MNSYLEEVALTRLAAAYGTQKSVHRKRVTNLETEKPSNLETQTTSFTVRISNGR